MSQLFFGTPLRGISCALMSSALLQAAPIPSEQLAQSGPRMIPLTRAHQPAEQPPEQTANSLQFSGTAPHGAGAPFRILSGSQILWEGAAGENFELNLPHHTQRVYLLSLTQRNTDWQDLSWKPSPTKASQIISTSTINALDLGLRSGTHDSSATLRRVLHHAWMQGGDCTITIPKGIYHFYPEGALEMSFYSSNHDQQDISPVGVPIVNFKKLTINAQGSTFIFHGKMQPLLIMDSHEIELQNLHIAQHTAYSTEALIVDNAQGKTRVHIAPELFDWKVHNGRFYNKGHQWEEQVNNAAVFKASGQMAALHRAGDLVWTSHAQDMGDNEVLFHHDTASLGLEKGDTLILRSYSRPHPAMLVYRSKDVSLRDVVFHDAQGMALLAQRSEDISIKGGGCLRREGRLHTTAADATHFSNCRGHISVGHAHFESMMDDAINVHATCLSITEIKEGRREIISRYMHKQAIGFEVALPGERLQFIKGRTLENHGAPVRVQSVERLDERSLRILLEEELPAEIGLHDAWENADWYPSVHFHHNLIRWNRARGALITTPAPVLIEHNTFDHGSGSAILLAGDAQGWYESGRCLDVTIRHNKFIQNLTSGYQFTEGIISIYPEVKQPDAQQTPYHQRILIENNLFVTHRVPLVFAISATGIIFRDNEVHYNDNFPPRHGGSPFVLRHCPPQALEEIRTKKFQR